MDHSHEPEDIAARLALGPKINYAIVAGVIGADLSAGIVLILGAANLLADGFSMAAANYSGTKADNDDVARIRQIELRHIRLHPEGEREELRQIYQAKGFAGEELESMVELLSRQESVWLETMLREEHGLSSVKRSPIKAALATFVAFITCGAVPLLPFIFGLDAGPLTATLATALVFFIIGAMKSAWSTQRWYWSGIETFVIGIAAAGMAFAVGVLLRGLAGG